MNINYFEKVFINNPNPQVIFYIDITDNNEIYNILNQNIAYKTICKKYLLNENPLDFLKILDNNQSWNNQLREILDQKIEREFQLYNNIINLDILLLISYLDENTLLLSIINYKEIYIPNEILPNVNLIDYQIQKKINELSIIAITDYFGIILYVNQKFCEISKYTKDELIGKTHKLVNSGFHNDQFFKDLWSQIKSGQVWKGEIKNKAKDGSFYWVDTTIVPIEDKIKKNYRFLAIRNLIDDKKRIEEINNNLYEFANVADIEIDLVGNQIYFSKAFLKIIDLNIEVLTLNYDDFLKIIHPSERDSFQKAVNNLIYYDKKYQAEHRIISKKNIIKWIKFSLSLEILDKENNHKIVGVIQDISSQVSLEKKLIENTSKLLILSLNSPDLLILLNKKFEIVYVNREIFNFDMSDLLDSNLFEHLPSELQSIFLTSLQKVIQTFSIVIEEYKIKKFEKIEYFKLTIVPIINLNNLESFYIVISNITDLKSTQLKLTETQHLLEESNSLARVGGWYYNKELRKLTLTQMSFEILGLSNSNTVKFNDLLTLKENYSLKKFFFYLFKKIIKSKTLVSRDFEYYINPSKKIWISFVGKCIIENSKIKYIMGAIQDIQKFKEVLSELIIQKEKAETESKAKTGFIAKISHELRTPLNGIIGFSELLIESDLQIHQKKYSENIHLSSLTLLDTINNVLDYSKLDNNFSLIDEYNTSLYQICEECIEIVKFNAAKKGIDLILNIEENVPEFVTVDKSRLKQVFINLLGNAVKFTNQGEVELRVQFKKFLNSISGKFHISIRDTGIGISDKNKRNIFSEYNQGDISVSKKYGGTGLGLAITKMIINNMKGNIYLESELGKGSVFHIEMEKMYQREKDIDPNYKLDVNVILLIENKNIEKIIINYFKKFYINFIIINSLRELKDEHKNVEFILIDQLFLTEQFFKIKKLKFPFEIKKIITFHSALEGADFFNRCYENDIKIFIEKPITPTKLKFILNNFTSNDIKKDKFKELNHDPLNLENKKSVNFLIVDDLPLNRMLLIDYLTAVKLNFNFIEADDGKDALEKFQKNQFDMVFLDIHMPNLNGYETSMKIREIELKENRKKVPIIAVSAGVYEDEMNRSISSGMNDFLEKPLLIKTLKEILKKYSIGNL
jgi:PAS domain S-box-containing protein